MGNPTPPPLDCKKTPKPPGCPPEEDLIRYCPQDAGLAQFTCQTGKSAEQLCSEQPQIRGCVVETPPKEELPLPLAEAPECTDPETGVPILCNILGEEGEKEDTGITEDEDAEENAEEEEEEDVEEVEEESESESESESEESSSDEEESSSSEDESSAADEEE